MLGMVVGATFVAAFNTLLVMTAGAAMIVIFSKFISGLPYAVRSSAVLRQVSPSPGKGGRLANVGR